MKYEEEALSTLSNQFHGDKVTAFDLGFAVGGGIRAANKIDAIKKAIFYGRDFETAFNGSTYLTEKICEKSGINKNTIHGILGVFSEAGELLEIINDAFSSNKKPDLINLQEEIGDCFWYLAILAKEAGMSFEDIMAQNIAKLKARYPDKFTEEQALNRDLEKERSVLEDTSVAVDTTTRNDRDAFFFE